jgi:hypothetical protein
MSGRGCAQLHPPPPQPCQFLASWAQLDPQLQQAGHAPEGRGWGAEVWGSAVLRRRQVGPWLRRPAAMQLPRTRVGALWQLGARPSWQAWLAAPSWQPQAGSPKLAAPSWQPKAGRPRPRPRPPAPPPHRPTASPALPPPRPPCLPTSPLPPQVGLRGSAHVCGQDRRGRVRAGPGHPPHDPGRVHLAHQDHQQPEVPGL